MGQLSLTGSLDAGPPSVTSADFPGASFSVPLRFRENTKAFGVASGVIVRRLNSASVFAPLQGVGPSDTVVQGNFLYLKSDADFQLRLTFDDGSGGSTLAVYNVSGVVVLEISSTQFLKLLEGKGIATLEYFVSGTQ